jgi:arylsulfatase A
MISVVSSCDNKRMVNQHKPSIIFILADDLGYNELGCYGQEIIQTPNIDQLAAEGIRFTNHYSGSPVCAPSRCVLMTGLHTGHSFIRDNYEIKPEGQLPIPDSVVTIAEILKRYGYQTAIIGKWGLGFPGSEGDPSKQGFDFFYGYNCQRHAHNHYPCFLWRNNDRDSLEGNNRTLTGEQYSQDLFTSEAIKFISDNRDHPFFLYLPFAIPHLSIQVPDGSLEQYRDKIPEEEYQHRYYEKHPYPRAGYAAMVSHMDRDIGRIMELLKELGIDNNTLVFFASDNGPTYARIGGSDSEYFNSAGSFRGLKGSVYEGGIRVPMIVRWPGKIKAGAVTDHLSGFQDLLPTIAEVINADVPAEIDGISYLPTLMGNIDDQPSHDYLYWEFPSYGGQQALRMGNWKAVRKDLFKNPGAPLELYNLETDIAEQYDVSSGHGSVVLKMEQMMKEARIQSLQFPFYALDSGDTISNAQ